MSKTLLGVKEEEIQVSFPCEWAGGDGAVISVTKKLFEVNFDSFFGHSLHFDIFNRLLLICLSKLKLGRHFR
jgi:hypothetical protein